MLVGWAFPGLDFLDSIFAAYLEENDKAVHGKSDEDKGEPIEISLVIVHGIILITVALKIGLMTGKFTFQSDQKEVENSGKDVKIQGCHLKS